MTSSETIQGLTDAMNAFVAAMGWYRQDSAFVQSPRKFAVSLALEAAEVLNTTSGETTPIRRPLPRSSRT